MDSESKSCWFVCQSISTDRRLDHSKNGQHDIPSLDSANENKLAAIYASMDPSNEEHAADADPSKCEIR